MSNGDLSQEQYLAQTPLKDICIRGVKKLVTEVTSIKTLAMITIGTLNYLGKIDSMSAVVGLLGLVGAKEIDFTEITNIVKSRFGGK
jgi:hypothetical protein